jgi:hypothetical protein
MGRVLAIGVHGQGMREALRRRQFNAVQHGGPFADIARQHQHTQRSSFAAIARRRAALPSVLPSTTTQTGAHCASAPRTVSSSLTPGL